MASSNNGCYSSATVNNHSIAGTPALPMVYTPPPLQTVFSFEADDPYCLDFDDLFLYSDFGFGDSGTQPEWLPTMENSEEERWLEGGDSVSVSGNLLSTSLDNDKSYISSVDLSSGSGSALSKSDFSSFSAPLSPTISFNSQFQPDSSFSPLPTTSNNTNATLKKESRKRSRKEEEEEDEVMFIVEGDPNALYDGYSWRKYGEKSIKHRDFRRSYYRCGHDGCKVRKQVERSTENPAAYLITYYGRHNHHADTSFISIGYN